jgi:hypothetical protein
MTLYERGGVAKNFFFSHTFFSSAGETDNDLILGSDWFKRSGPIPYKEKNQFGLHGTTGKSINPCSHHSSLLITGIGTAPLEKRRRKGMKTSRTVYTPPTIFLEQQKTT